MWARAESSTALQLPLASCLYTRAQFSANTSTSIHLHAQHHSHGEKQCKEKVLVNSPDVSAVKRLEVLPFPSVSKKISSLHFVSHLTAAF